MRIRGKVDVDLDVTFGEVRVGLYRSRDEDWLGKEWYVCIVVRRTGGSRNSVLTITPLAIRRFKRHYNCV